jgi:hypothetical protein
MNPEPTDYWSVRNPIQFDRAIEAATEDGRIHYWSWSQLLGVIAPPTPAETEDMKPLVRWC